MADPKLNSTELNDDGTDNYLVGTVKLERNEDGTHRALWVKVNRAMVRRGEHVVADEWLCIEASQPGLQGLARSPYYVQEFPVVGVVPMSAAAQAENPFEVAR